MGAKASINSRAFCFGKRFSCYECGTMMEPIGLEDAAENGKQQAQLSLPKRDRFKHSHLRRNFAYPVFFSPTDGFSISSK
mmetsp:Transcript_15216/g.38308  ORF Transcript_15216/g.38308 Transcript_15216/m.38308 type:complete len:80 (+) Transcript_15216:1658-1897(+)